MFVILWTSKMEHSTWGLATDRIGQPGFSEVASHALCLFPLRLHSARRRKVRHMRWKNTPPFKYSMCWGTYFLHIFTFSVHITHFFLLWLTCVAQRKRGSPLAASFYLPLFEPLYMLKWDIRGNNYSVAVSKVRFQDCLQRSVVGGWLAPLGDFAGGDRGFGLVQVRLCSGGRLRQSRPP